jgi:hypothetical protein
MGEEVDGPGIGVPSGVAGTMVPVSAAICVPSAEERAAEVRSFAGVVVASTAVAGASRTSAVETRIAAAARKTRPRTMKNTDRNENRFS